MSDEFATVGLRNFDLGLIATTMKGTLIDYNVDGGTRQVYAKEIPNLNCGDSVFGNKIPIVFAFPEDVYSTYRLPTYVVTRTSLTPAFDRAPWFGYQRKPTSDALPVTVQNPQDSTKTLTGYSKYVSKWNAHPFNIGYDVKVLGRTQAEGQMMLIDALKIFRPPFFTFGLLDSHGDLREYDAGEVSISETSELADVGDRSVGWTISFEVRGELDLVAEQIDDHPITNYPIVDTSTLES